MITEKEIYERWPRVFPDRPDNTDMQTSCMFWGLEVPTTWLPIIDALAETLQGFADNWTTSTSLPRPWPVRQLMRVKAGRKLVGWAERRWPRLRTKYETVYYGQVQAEQVKSKWGGLRFYYAIQPNPRGQTDFAQTDRMARGAIALAETLIDQLERHDRE